MEPGIARAILPRIGVFLGNLRCWFIATVPQNDLRHMTNVSMGPNVSMGMSYDSYHVWF